MFMNSSQAFSIFMYCVERREYEKGENPMFTEDNDRCSAAFSMNMFSSYSKWHLFINVSRTGLEIGKCTVEK